ncbi:family 43 glycosylhydrolase [Rhodocytophaga aerolata]|uniref:Family 43 glycosylhydrolase n=1 Tax=Rhodocytophaga aerolata TaxID=455078 RepID=A0ABT8REF5_9BACT|nr:family 43 glycosylhydrolase [Rhodocytophaga aerolata]MDO1450485.1 family 43 glycosylhydrolase [Rhodocytophaga aerolata]
MKKLLYLYCLLFCAFYSCRQSAGTEEASTDTLADTTTQVAVSTISFTNPVLPGDFADPSVTKVGDTYWATATSSEWAPLFPLLKSTNLVDWEIVGHVFPDKSPDWADAHFWAPEIAYENGKTYIYYTGKKKGGNLCVGVASADNPAGPYTDHGPLVCQPVGSIDGFPIRDENGQLYLIWKEDGNSQNQPTPIWGQQMNEERTKLLGEKFELIRNDKPWEGRLVEGPALFKRGEYFYMIYAGDACCGKECTYATGVARAKKLTGPWEKYAKNPILTKNETWKCPGHGTVITDASDNYYFLYHAYNTDSFVYPGRQGLLDRFTFNAEGWPVFESRSPSARKARIARNDMSLQDEFTSDSLLPTWQWPVNISPSYKMEDDANGTLQLKAKTNNLGSVLAQRTKSANYEAITEISKASLKNNLQAGLAAIGDPENAIGVSTTGKRIILWQVKGGKQNTLTQTSIPDSAAIQLRLVTRGGDKFQFSWSIDGTTWNQLGQEPVNGSYLPPWDRGVRVGLVAKGVPSTTAQFNWFRLTNN